MEHALPRRTAGTPRSWSLRLTSENHGAVGPLGSTFPHAGEKHERVQVVEIVAAGSPPAPGVDLSGLMRFGFCDINDDEFVERPDGAYFLAHQVEERVTSAPAAKPVGEFKGYVDGQPAVSWFNRDNMPRVGTKLFASAAPASTVLTDDEDLLDVVRTLCAVAARRGELLPERLKHYPHVDEEGSPVLVAARAACVARGYTEDGLSVEGVIYPVAAQAGQVAVPFKWPNGCDETVPRALRYLANNSRPSGGEDHFNSAHLYQLAGEIEQAARKLKESK